MGMQQKRCLKENLEHSMHILEKEKDLKAINLSLHLRKPEKEEQCKLKQVEEKN